MVDRLAILNAAHPRRLQGGLHNPNQRRKSWYFFFAVPGLPEDVGTGACVWAIEGAGHYGARLARDLSGHTRRRSAGRAPVAEREAAIIQAITSKPMTAVDTVRAVGLSQPRTTHYEAVIVPG